MKNIAVIVVDMLKDNVYTESHSGMGVQARGIIPNIQRLLRIAREKGMPVVFANDAFLPSDFIFRETGVKPHAIMGTEGARVIDEFGPEESDIILEKRRFSAFLGTNLDVSLRETGVDTIVVTGIGTPICVLTTALDGVAHDFKVIMLEDCCAAFRPEDHEAIVSVYRSCLRRPLSQVITLDDFLSTLTADN
ncbi:MAG: cysteine hydrolase [Chloroflexi bacterium]|jgi:nicotinamidase/pyrazinamidase|nr:cysteine hydrolase [Chloroflexota bacterium]